VVVAQTTLSREIWTQKYRFQAPDGCGDSSLEDTWRRVSAAIAANEAPEAREHWERRFYDALADFRFIPAGRILAGAGTGREVTLFNCFVMGVIPDDLDGIFQHLREAALTMQQGGGVGMNFSTIRPAGAPVRGVGAQASGPLSFMDSWNAMCGTIMAAGQRRGAMMGCLRIDHPDIESFIEAKRDKNRFRNFNLSVLVTDAFMETLAADGEWDLRFNGVVYRKVAARELWRQLMRATYDVAEPGVIFIDRVNQHNNLAYCEEIVASNPCGEQMLPAYGACLLGSINLAQLVSRPFASDSTLDEEQLAELTATAVRFLDNVIDVSRYPLPQQEIEAKGKRRIGLGITGLADALLFCNTRYGSSQAIALTCRWLDTIRHAAYRASAALAAEKGSFALYDETILDRPNLLTLDEQTRALIRDNGLRNGCLTSIAPTGTTSLLAGNVSSGIEPVFAYSYTRKVRQPDGSTRDEAVEDHGYQVWKRVNGDAPPPEDLFVSAQSLAPSDHLAMQAPAQRLIDSSISKTVNCPEDIGFEAFADIYAEAYHLGCKGLTTYRPNATTGSVLSVDTTQKAGSSPPEHVLEPRPESLHGSTYKIKWPNSAHAIYVTINDLIEDGCRRPFEMFINSKNMEHYAWTLGLTRMISAVLRRGGDIRFVAEELQAVFDPRGGAWLNRRHVPSLMAAIGDVLERHIAALDGSDSPRADPPVPAEPGEAAPVGSPCTQCGRLAMHRQEGCDKCLECGYSKCG